MRQDKYTREHSRCAVSFLVDTVNSTVEEVVHLNALPEARKTGSRLAFHSGLEGGGGGGGGVGGCSPYTGMGG
jgi:hypothetical protein